MTPRNVRYIESKKRRLIELGIEDERVNILMSVMFYLVKQSPDIQLDIFPPDDTNSVTLAAYLADDSLDITLTPNGNFVLTWQRQWNYPGHASSELVRCHEPITEHNVYNFLYQYVNYHERLANVLNN